MRLHSMHRNLRMTRHIFCPLSLIQIRFLLPITFNRPLQHGQEFCSSLLTKNTLFGVFYDHAFRWDVLGAIVAH